MTEIGDNRLTVLSSEIREHHAGVKAAAEVAAAHAIAAGQALVEAKALVSHGQWLPWLEANCGFAERTAQLYMRIAEKNLSVGTIAVLGLKGAATAFEIHDPSYNPFAGCDAEAKRQWLLFACWVGGWDHAEWVINKQFVSPDEWLGPIGEAQRRSWGMRSVSDELRASWDDYLTGHQFLTQEEAEQRLAGIEDRALRVSPPRVTRRRRKSATVADLAKSRTAEIDPVAERLKALAAETDPAKRLAGIAALAAELGTAVGAA